MEQSLTRDCCVLRKELVDRVGAIHRQIGKNPTYIDRVEAACATTEFAGYFNDALFLACGTGLLLTKKTQDIFDLGF